MSDFIHTVDELIIRSRGFIKKLTGRPTYFNYHNRQLLATVPKDVVDLLVKEGINSPVSMDWTVTKRAGQLIITLDNIKHLTSNTP
ncbi:MAG TPA: hypothetical protein VEG61_04445 [Candidatus Dormibacteraeota bacterium]|nr:hypothetical protein [Candidatus Dormibacteraeota bacterium]